VNHLVLVRETKDMEGMLFKAKDYITFGKIKKETLVQLLKKRGKLSGDKALTVEFLKKNKYNSFEDLADKILDKEELPEFIKPVFRMRPPSKGYARGGIKKPVAMGGTLGNLGDKINDLISRMC
jgi:large subunit ribosomal protein L30